jgi:hypothetical protein
MAVVAFLSSVALKTPVTTNCSSLVASVSGAPGGEAAVDGAGAVWAVASDAERETERRRARERGSRGAKEAEGRRGRRGGFTG